MKKLGLVLTTVLFSTQVFAAATLRVPLLLNDGNSDKNVPVAALNAKLAAKGIQGFPESLDITADTGYNTFQAAQQKLAQILKSLGEDPEEMSFVVGLFPTAIDTAQSRTCYTGNPTEVPDAIRSLIDIGYSDQLNMFAMKYKQTATPIDENTDLTDSDTQDFLNGSNKWKNFKGQDESILILSSVGDGGDDIQESLIPKCK